MAIHPMTESKYKPSQPLTLDRPAQYKIEIQGQLNESWSVNFGNMTLSLHTTSGNLMITILQGVVADQAALHGMLNSIRDLGLPLLKVEYLSTFEPGE
jgi:hypothetical protein